MCKNRIFVTSCLQSSVGGPIIGLIVKFQYSSLRSYMGPIVGQTFVETVGIAWFDKYLV